MTVKVQRKIKFVNDCECIVDFQELAKAIMWQQKKPTISVKHIYLHGRYPCISIGKKKWHIHRLLMSYWEGGCIDRNTHVHHINGNRLDAKKSNLTLIDGRLHLSLHNKGKTISDKTKAAIIRFNHSRKGKRHKPKRKDVTPKIVFEYRSKGYSFNKISKLTGLDWGCVKQRYNDFLITKNLLKRNNNDKRTIQYPRS